MVYNGPSAIVPVLRSQCYGPSTLSQHYGSSTVVPTLWFQHYGPSTVITVLWSHGVLVLVLWLQHYGPSTMVFDLIYILNMIGCPPSPHSKCQITTNHNTEKLGLIIIWSQCYGPVLWPQCYGYGSSAMVLQCGPSTMVPALWLLTSFTYSTWLVAPLTPFQMLN